MANHGILIQNKVMAQTVDSLNRAAVGAADVDNGNVVQLLTRNTAATRGLEEVWDATQPSASAGLQNLWMVYEPEVVTTVSGSQSFKGIDPDPRNFYLVAGTVYTVFKPQLGDILRLTDDALGGTKSSNGFVVATASTYELTWAASAAAGLSLKLLGTEYISLGTGAIDPQRVVAYDFEVVALA